MLTNTRASRRARSGALIVLLVALFLLLVVNILVVLLSKSCFTSSIIRIEQGLNSRVWDSNPTLHAVPLASQAIKYFDAYFQTP